MKYLLMCCHEEKKWDSMSKSECDAVMETMAYYEALKRICPSCRLSPRSSGPANSRAAAIRPAS